MSEHEPKEPIEHQDTKEQASRTQSKHLPKPLRVLIAVVGSVVVISGLFVLYAYVTTPAIIRNPAFQHLHFRMQIAVDGKSVNFAEKEFQTPAGHDVCNADLTKQPIH